MRRLWTFLMDCKAWWITSTVLVFGGLLLLALLNRDKGESPFVYSLF